MKTFREIFWSIVFIMVFVFGNLAKERHEIDDDVKRSIDTTLLSLNEKDLKLSTSGHSLDILGINIHRTDKQIERMLRATGDKSGIFSYRYGDVGTYTMSAQAVDGFQNLVNSYLEGYQPFVVENVMMPLYVLAQRKSYLLDEKQYLGRQDVWQTSRQAFYYPRGDCEDHALVLADWLIEMGEDARVVIGAIPSGGHAWVILFKNGKEYLLEATKKSGLSRTKPYPLAALHTDYLPEYMFNRHYFWVNTDTKYTTEYSGAHWQKKSRYNVNNNASAKL